MAQPMPVLTSSRHPYYLGAFPDWTLWRDIWDGGDNFVRKYLKKFSKRESEPDFEARKQITPIPGFAKAALVDIKNAIYSKMPEITRRGGSNVYQNAVDGYKGGVDRRGVSMNNFIGTQVLPDLLLMGKVGVYVDNIAPSGPTLADARTASPYVYMYRVEDILSWTCSHPEDESDFQAVLLRDWCLDYNQHMHGVMLPKNNRIERYRLVWIGEDGYVHYQFYDSSSNPITPTGEPGGSVTKLNLRRIPFTLCDIGDSLLRDVASYQVALLNLLSSDINYALKSNYPFYTEQQDGRAQSSHLKTDVMEDGTASSGGQSGRQQEIAVGTHDGRVYGPGMDRPGFIAPPSGPLEASMNLQRKMEDDIRKLVNLAVISLGNSRASGSARSFDNQGLEAGLSYIGLVLETAERKIADHWAAYEGNDKRDNVVVRYPEHYRLRPQDERISDAKALTELMFSIPSTEAKKELAKDAIISLMGGRIPPDQMEKIFKEITSAQYSTSNPDVVKLAKEQGLASDVTLSNALGFNGEKEVEQAEKDHAKRIARIQEAQGVDPGARGAGDLSADPQAGKKEKEASRDNTMKDDTKDRTRGEGEDNEEDDD